MMNRDETPRIAVVTGASGALGPALVRRLVADGYRVRTFNRVPTSPEIARIADDVVGDLLDVDLLRRTMDGSDVVFHLAALLHITRPDEATNREYDRVNRQGTETVIEAATRAGVRRVVFFSTIAVYGGGQGEFFDESSATNPETAYAASKVAAESIVVSARNQAGEPLGVVLRLGAVYGPLVKGNYRQLVQALSAHRFFPIGDGSNRRTLIFEEDVANAAILAASHPTVGGEVFNITDGSVHTVAEIIDSICRALGRRPPRFSLPVAPIRIALRIADLLSRMTHVPFSVGSSTLDKYLEDVAVSGEKARKLLGFKPQYSFDEGWQRTVDGFVSR